MDALITWLEPTLGGGGALLAGGLLAVSLALLPVIAIGGVSTLVERKVAADMQKRIGPNWSFLDAWERRFGRGVSTGLLRAAAVLPGLRFVLRGPGTLQFLVDGVKLLIKEDVIPRGADRPLFKLAPYLVLMASLTVFVVVPYSRDWQVVDLDIGVFFVVALSSGVVLGLLMGGWASNNKWSALGGFRSAAQVVSFEVPVGLCLLTVVLISGSMRMQGLVAAQQVPTWMTAGAGDWVREASFLGWNLFGWAGTESAAGLARALLLVPLFGVYFVASLAECNRTPFDIPEAESELVAGYHTEYTGMRFAFFMLVEYADMVMVSALAVVLFLGGYQLPLFDRALCDPATGLLGAHESAWVSGLALNLLQAGVFLTKVYLLILVQMWLRWTLPRLRVDQLMRLCWTKLVPLSFGAFLLVAASMV